MHRSDWCDRDYEGVCFTVNETARLSTVAGRCRKVHLKRSKLFYTIKKKRPLEHAVPSHVSLSP
jgi:hypothetical protein